MGNRLLQAYLVGFREERSQALDRDNVRHLATSPDPRYTTNLHHILLDSHCAGLGLFATGILSRIYENVANQIRIIHYLNAEIVEMRQLDLPRD